MDMPRRLVLAVVVASVTIGFGIGKVVTAPAAEASAAHRFTLRVGDTVTIPGVSQRCAVYTEGRSRELYCARPLHPHHQVTIYGSRRKSGSRSRAPAISAENCLAHASN